jgi:hypothetical protein
MSDELQLMVWHIVKKWYTEGMYPDILQDEDGTDLEEICDIAINAIYERKERESRRSTEGVAG